MKNPTISLEVFPTKDKNNILLKELEELSIFNLSYISVTYGAGGSNNSSIDLTSKIQNNIGITAMQHFTCINTSRGATLEFLKSMKRHNINHILALRGDLPKNKRVPNIDFPNASNLVSFIKENSNLNIAVAGYPESHPQSKSLKEDIKYLKNKVDCGASMIVTQLFYDNSFFLNFRDLCLRSNIKTPICAGILPISKVEQLKKIINLTSCKIPKNLSAKLAKHIDDPIYIHNLGIEYACRQCEELIKNDVDGIHIYTLNLKDISKNLLTRLFALI